MTGRETCGQCGEPMITRPGDLEATCGGCGQRPGSCPCPPAGTGGGLPPGDGQAPHPAEASLLTGLRNGAWLDGQVFPDLAYAVPGLIPEGLVINVGAPKVGKSWLVLDCGLAVAAGGRALSAIDTGPRRRVLYLALEDGHRRLQSRCRRLLGDGQPIPPWLDYLIRVRPGQVTATIGEWLGVHGGDRPLVVLDTLGKVMPPALMGESAYSRDYRAGSDLKALADAHPGTTVLVNHHDRKADSRDFVDSVSGTNGLAGAADAILVLTRDRNSEDGLLQLTGRDIPEGAYALTFSDGAYWQLAGGGLAASAGRGRNARAVTGLGDRSAEVVAFALARPDGVKAADVAGALGLDVAVARTYLNRARDAGRLARVGRGLFGPPYQPSVMSVMSVMNGENAQVSGPGATITAAPRVL